MDGHFTCTRTWRGKTIWYILILYYFQSRVQYDVPKNKCNRFHPVYRLQKTKQWPRIIWNRGKLSRFVSALLNQRKLITEDFLGPIKCFPTILSVELSSLSNPQIRFFLNISKLASPLFPQYANLIKLFCWLDRLLISEERCVRRNFVFHRIVNLKYANLWNSAIQRNSFLIIWCHFRR